MYEQFRNKLIVFEGIDGTGKSTMAKLLSDILNKVGIPTVLTFQPGDPTYGDHANILRSMCIEKKYNLHPLTNFFLFFADKVEQAHKVIKPALEAGRAIISDRWWYSTYAYQYIAKSIETQYSMSKETGEWLNMSSVLNLDPDIVFYFDKVLEDENDQNDLFESEKEEFKSRVAYGYNKLYIESLSTQKPWIKVDTVIGNISETLTKMIDSTKINV